MLVILHFAMAQNNVCRRYIVSVHIQYLILGGQLDGFIIQKSGRSAASDV